MKYTFGQFVLDVNNKTLTKDGSSVDLNQKAFRTLHFLVDHRGTRKSREEIAVFVWDLESDTKWKWNNNDIDTIISGLRTTLGDRSKPRKFIETITRRMHPDGGYQFIAEVTASSWSVGGDNGPVDTENIGFIAESEWVSLLNKIPDVKVYGLIGKVPQINIDGEYHIEDEDREAVDQKAKTLTHEDIQAVVEEEPEIDGIPLIFRAKKLRYAAVSVLRNKRKNPFVLSANAVLVCPEMSRVIVDLRSNQTDTYESVLHTVGGAFEVAKDNVNLKRTAMREVLEEVGISTSIDARTPILVSQEISTRFLQIVFLGVHVPKNELSNVESTWESASLIQIPFDRLKEYLVDENNFSWVPTGKAHVLAWLACGAPGCQEGTKFGGKTAKQLFRDITSHY